jgi:hypothetical protein
MAELKVLAVGDVVGSPGRRAVAGILPRLVTEEQIGFVVANAENAAGGSGLTPAVVAELLNAGCHCLTTGDHVYKNREGLGVVQSEPRLLRPANLPKRSAGRGWGVYEAAGGLKVAVVNLLGRSFMAVQADNPFECAERILAELAAAAPDVVLLDFHAEATAEKVALGRFLDGRVAAVWGTHTHVATADEALLPNGTGYVTDLGMTGPHDSVIGREVTPVVETLLTGMPTRWDVAEGDVRLSGAIFTLDAASGRCTGVKRVQLALK